MKPLTKEQKDDILFDLTQENYWDIHYRKDDQRFGYVTTRQEYDLETARWIKSIIIKLFQTGGQENAEKLKEFNSKILVTVDDKGNQKIEPLINKENQKIVESLKQYEAQLTHSKKYQNVRKRLQKILGEEK